MKRVIIHLDRKSPPIHFEAYGPRVVPVYNYFQAGLVLFADDRLRAEAVGRLGTTLVRRYEFTPRMLLRSFQDTLRRGVLDYEAAQRLGRQGVRSGIDAEVVRLFAQEAEEMNMVPVVQKAQHVPDYPALLRREQNRHKIEKQRRRRLQGRWL